MVQQELSLVFRDPEIEKGNLFGAFLTGRKRENQTVKRSIRVRVRERVPKTGWVPFSFPSRRSNMVSSHWTEPCASQVVPSPPTRSDLCSWHPAFQKRLRLCRTHLGRAMSQVFLPCRPRTCSMECGQCFPRASDGTPTVHPGVHGRSCFQPGNGTEVRKERGGTGPTPFVTSCLSECRIPVG